jgi:isoquinoline 1-oxidoreductase subunit beta
MSFHENIAARQAAGRWRVPTGKCAAAPSIVIHRPSGRTLRFGEPAGASAKARLAKQPVIKTPAQFTFLPRRVPKLDLARKTDESAQFGIDAPVPGMVFASINACPVRGGKLKGVDESVLEGLPGIMRVVKLEDAVAVVATDSYRRAERALSRLQPEWDVGAAGHVDSEQHSREFRAALKDCMVVARNDRDVDKTLSGAPKTLEAIY